MYGLPPNTQRHASVRKPQRRLWQAQQLQQKLIEAWLQRPSLAPGVSLHVDINDRWVCRIFICSGKSSMDEKVCTAHGSGHTCMHAECWAIAPSSVHMPIISLRSSRENTDSRNHARSAYTTWISNQTNKLNVLVYHSSDPLLRAPGYLNR